MTIKTIHVNLLNEGIEVSRPIKAIQLRNLLFKIIDEDYDPNLEEWEFKPGDTVKCKKRKNHLIAYEIFKGDK